MVENWIEFDEGPTQTCDRFYVSMSLNGEILFNRYVFEEMNSPEAIVMLYDPNADKIGLRPASRLTPNAFPIKSKGRCGNRLIRARPFMLKHDLRIDGTVRFLAAEFKDGILVLSLRKMQKVRRIPMGARRGR